MRANSRIRVFLRELRLSPEERTAARAERRAEAQQLRAAGHQHTPEGRAAALEAQRRREYPTQSGIGGI
jgi:hypothetical protein